MGDALTQRSPSRWFTASLAILLTASLLLMGGVAPGQQARADETAAVPSGQIPLTGQLGTHDPTLFHDDTTERYVVAATHNSVRSAPSLNGPWTVEGSVPMPDWGQEIGAATMWAPHVQQVEDTYFYYYSLSTFGSQNSAIGVKTTQTPTDPSSYVDHGEPIITSGDWSDLNADDPYDHNAIDPQVHQDEDGSYWLTWGSHWDGIMIQRLDDDMVTPVGEMTLIASRVSPQNPIEGPAIFSRNGFYYLVTGWDRCCAAADSTYKIAVGRAETIDGPYLDKNGVPLTEGGGTTILDSRVTQPGVTPSGLYRAPGGPDVFVEDDVHYLVYHAYRPQITMGIRPMDWHDDWPYFQEPGGGPYDRSDGAYHRLVSESEPPSEFPDIERVPGPDGFGDAVRLNGPSPVAYVEMPTGVVSDLDGDFSISSWVNRATTSGQQWARLFDLGTSGDTNMSLAVHGGTGGPRYAIRTMGGADIEDVNAPSSAFVPAGQWTHLAVTYEGTTLTIHLNGQPVASGTITLRPSDLGITDRNWIGRSQFPDPLLNGTVDDVNIFSRALSQEEVQALMDEPGGGELVGGGDVLWYRFDEDGGSTAIDSSGSGNHGEVVVPVFDEDRLHNPVPGDQCLTAVTDGDATDVIQSECDDVSLAQVWRLDWEDDATYRLRSSAAGGQYCLQMEDASGEPGTNVGVASCDGSDERQRWTLGDTGHGFHRPVVVAGNLALEIENTQGAIGTNVVGGIRRDPPIANRWPPQQWMFSQVSMSASQVLAAFDGFVADGGLVGVGPGRSADQRLAAFRAQLVSVVEALEAGDYPTAHTQLTDSLHRIDGDGATGPSHFVSGEDAAALDTLLRTLRDAIG